MAFRHGQHGAITNKGVVWHCPSCNAENTGALEAGCQACKAGADAAIAAGQAQHPIAGNPFEAWLDEQYPTGVDTSHFVIARKAWVAGVQYGQWQQQQTAPVGNTPQAGSGGGTGSTPAAPEGGYTVELISPRHVHLPVDPQTHATILAALAFYRDNQLAYGVIPGQLSAQECTQLITQLSPPEEEAPK